MIHSTALVDKTAKLSSDIKIGPYSVIGPDVEMGPGCEIGSHVVISGPTKIGAHNRIFQFCSIGEAPQDKKYANEPTRLEIGDHNVIREFCTLNRGTQGGGGITSIGHHNLLMAYVHVAHDCMIANNVVLANNASLAGHVQLDDFVILGGLSGVHQFCRLGAYSFAAGGSMIAKDVPAFVKVSGYYAKPFGLNSVGLQRHGFTIEQMADIKRMYKIIYRNNLHLNDAIAVIKSEFANDPNADLFLSVIENSPRGIVR